jgi:hypothetical protein
VWRHALNNIGLVAQIAFMIMPVVSPHNLAN